MGGGPRAGLPLPPADSQSLRIRRKRLHQGAAHPSVVRRGHARSGKVTEPHAIEASQGIKRSNHRESDATFVRLREEAVRLAQAASGERWTDYNLHDPGVTLLEQLCYGLTDIAYRIDFPVADHLSAPGDDIAFGNLALHAPDVIFPCRPTTGLDYRRVLLGQVEGVDDARVIAAETPGVFCLLLRVAPAPSPG